MKWKIKVPIMPKTTRVKFAKDVRKLLERCHWKPTRIRDWAISADSGYGRYWQSPEHALEKINEIDEAIKAQNRRIAGAIRSSNAEQRRRERKRAIDEWCEAMLKRWGED